MAAKSRWLKVLGRFKLSELPEVAVQLGVDLPRGKTKKEILSALVDICLTAKISPLAVLNMELHYFFSHPNSLQWKAYKLEYVDPCSISTANADSKVFLKRLQLYLGDTSNYEMVQDMKPPGYWLCIHIKDYSCLPYTCCLLRCPPSPYLFVGNLKKTHFRVVLQAINLALDSRSCTEMGLTGKNLDSLVDMVLNQHSQGSLSAYRLNQVDSNPLLAASKRSRLAPEEKQGAEEEEEDVEPEARRHRAAEEAFGTNPLPTLEEFSFELVADLPDSTNSVSCFVKFAGTSVFEGTKAAIANADCFSPPVPSVIRRMAGCASNSATLPVT